VFRILSKQIKINFYSGAIKSGFIWIISLLVFFLCTSINPNGANSTITSVLIINVIVGILSYLVLIYSLTNILDLKLKKYKSKATKYLKELIVILFVGFLIFGVPITVLWGMNRLSSLTTKINSSSSSTSTPQPLDENKLWNLINDWEKKQGYQQYLKDDVLCQKGEWLLNNDSILFNNKDWFEKTELNKSYYNASYNLAWDYPSEEKALDYWISNKDTLRNLKDTYFQYSCTKCKKFKCIQVFANLYSTNKNSPNISSINNDNEPYGVVKQVSEYTYTQKLGTDLRMGTPEEILIALNNFRNNNGKGSLTWDNDLASWAQSRAQTFVNLGNVDEHAGFRSEYEAKGKQFGRFSYFGENAAYGSKLEAAHLIEWVFASDLPHKENMLRDIWNTVGISIASGDGIYYGVDLIFGRTR